MENWYDISINYIKKHIADRDDYDFMKKHLDREKKLSIENNNLNKMRERLIEYIKTHEYPSMYRLRENDLSKKDMLDILEEVK